MRNEIESRLKKEYDDKCQQELEKKRKEDEQTILNKEIKGTEPQLEENVDYQWVKKEEWSVDLNNVKTIAIYKEDTQLFLWPSGNSFNRSIGMMDFLSCRESSLPGKFSHLNLKNQHVVTWVEKNYLFIVSSEDFIQYPFLEALLEEIVENFINTYQLILSSSFFESALFAGFAVRIPKMFHNMLNNRVKVIRMYCEMCKMEVDICIRNSLVEHSVQFPISYAFIHQGHILVTSFNNQFMIVKKETFNL